MSDLSTCDPAQRPATALAIAQTGQPRVSRRPLGESGIAVALPAGATPPGAAGKLLHGAGA